MRTSAGYGTRPDVLPAALRDAARDPASGVRVLDAAEDAQRSGESLGRFAAQDGVTLAWPDGPGVARSRWVDDADRVAQVDRSLAARVNGGARVVLVPDNLVVPSVELPVEVLRAHLPAVAEAFAGFWVFSPGDRLLVDCRWDGGLVVGPVPGGRPSPRAR